MYPKNDLLNNVFKEQTAINNHRANNINKIMGPIVNKFIQRDVKKLRR